MFQHYKSDQRTGTAAEYNQLLPQIPAWAAGVAPAHWYLWDKDEMEFADHLSLAEYLDNQEKRQTFNNTALQTSFLLGKFAFRRQDTVDDLEEYILTAINDLLPLYEQL